MYIAALLVFCYMQAQHSMFLQCLNDKVAASVAHHGNCCLRRTICYRQSEKDSCDIYTRNHHMHWCSTVLICIQYILISILRNSTSWQSTQLALEFYGTHLTRWAN